MTRPQKARRLPPVSEPEFQRQVVRLARLRGWLVAHFRPARTGKGWRTPVQADGAGFPDLVLVRGHRVLFVELKVGGRKPTPAQRRWLDALRATGLAVFAWTPADWPTIEDVLAPEDT